jgi:anti-sigma-K factor RskA
MASESDRSARAGDYVFGLMNATDRERAERDLEIDPAFRDAVVRFAARMQIFNRAGPALDGRPNDDHGWAAIAQRLAELPQMRPAGVAQHNSRAGIYRSERFRLLEGRQALGRWRAALIAFGLIASFALGYLLAKL